MGNPEIHWYHRQKLPCLCPVENLEIHWYHLGDAVEKHGRHMKRQAVAAEYNSGRNMREWARELGESERTIEDFVLECRRVELLGPTDTSVVSEALPTARAAREYAKAEPEVREVIKEIIKEDPQAEIKAAEIRKLRAERDELIRRVAWQSWLLLTYA